MLKELLKTAGQGIDTEGTMETQERQFVLDKLASSEARLLELVAGLSPAQWNFREKPERWSIAQILEHIILFESFISEAIEKALETPPEPGKRAQAAEKIPLILDLPNSRGTRLSAREAVRPSANKPDPNELVAQLRRIRARTLAFVQDTGADVHNHFFPHITFGDLDCYQWLVVLAQHATRHACQIIEIKEYPLFPAA